MNKKANLEIQLPIHQVKIKTKTFERVFQAKPEEMRESALKTLKFNSQK